MKQRIHKKKYCRPAHLSLVASSNYATAYNLVDPGLRSTLVGLPTVWPGLAMVTAKLCAPIQPKTADNELNSTCGVRSNVIVGSL